MDIYLITDIREYISIHLHHLKNAKILKEYHDIVRIEHHVYLPNLNKIVSHDDFDYDEFDVGYYYIDQFVYIKRPGKIDFMVNDRQITRNDGRSPIRNLIGFYRTLEFTPQGYFKKNLTYDDLYQN